MAIGRKPASISRSIPCTWRGESSGIFNLPCGRGRTRHGSFLDDWRLGSGICLGGTPFELRQDFAQRRDQLVPGNVAFLELNPEPKRFARRLKLKDERPRPLRPGLLLAAAPAGVSSPPAAPQGSGENLCHFLFRP